MYFDDIVKQAKAPIQQVFADKGEEMFVSIFKADGDDDDTGESLENPDDTGTDGGSPDAGGANDEGTGESLENPDDSGNQAGGDDGSSQGGDDGTGESLENPGEGNQDEGSGSDGNQDNGQGGQDDQGAGESLENPDASGGDQGSQDPNAQQQPAQDPNQAQQNPEDENEKKIKDINERILLFRKHRKLEDTVQVLYNAVSSSIGQVVTVDSRIKLIRIQKDLLVTRGQLEYAISLDFKTINMEKAEEIYKVIEKKVSLMSETLKKIRKENSEA